MLSEAANKSLIGMTLRDGSMMNLWATATGEPFWVVPQSSMTTVDGAATYSHDGYPASESGHYDTAADQPQRNVPRAFLRSATHEVGHAFNQIHQCF